MSIAEVKYFVKCFLPVLFTLFSTLLFSSQSAAVSLSVPKADPVLLAQLQNQIAADPALSKEPLTISVTDGDVSIQGSLANKAEAISLIILVESTAGVQSLNLAITFENKDESISSDEIINSEVIGTFNREGLMGPMSQAPINVSNSGPGIGSSFESYSLSPPPINIQVQTKNGVVTLSGTVVDQATIDRAVGLVRAISGVTDVQSNITIVSPP